MESHKVGFGRGRGRSLQMQPQLEQGQFESFSSVMDHPGDYLNPPLRRPNIASQGPPDVVAAVLRNNNDLSLGESNIDEGDTGSISSISTNSSTAEPGGSLTSLMQSVMIAPSSPPQPSNSSAQNSIIQQLPRPPAPPSPTPSRTSSIAFNPNAPEFVPSIIASPPGSLADEGEGIQSHVTGVLTFLAKNPASLDPQVEDLYRDLLQFLSWTVVENSKDDVKAIENERNETLDQIVTLIFEQSIAEYDKNFCYTAAKICQTLCERDLVFSVYGAGDSAPKMKSTSNFKNMLLAKAQDIFTQCLLSLDGLSSSDSDGMGMFKQEILKRTLGCLMFLAELFINFMNSEFSSAQSSATIFGMAAGELINKLVSYLSAVQEHSEDEVQVLKRIYLVLKLAGRNLENYSGSVAASHSAPRLVSLFKGQSDQIFPSIESFVGSLEALAKSENVPSDRLNLMKILMTGKDILDLKKKWNEPSSSSGKRRQQQRKPSNESNQSSTKVDPDDLEAEFNQFLADEEGYFTFAGEGSSPQDDYDSFLMSQYEHGEPNFEHEVFLDDEPEEIQDAYEQFLSRLG